MLDKKREEKRQVREREQGAERRTEHPKITELNHITTNSRNGFKVIILRYLVEQRIKIDLHLGKYIPKSRPKDKVS